MYGIHLEQLASETSGKSSWISAQGEVDELDGDQHACRGICGEAGWS